MLLDNGCPLSGLTIDQLVTALHESAPYWAGTSPRGSQANLVRLHMRVSGVQPKSKSLPPPLVPSVTRKGQLAGGPGRHCTRLHRRSDGDEPPSADYGNKVRSGSQIRINSGENRGPRTDATRSA